MKARQFLLISLVAVVLTACGSPSGTVSGPTSEVARGSSQTAAAPYDAQFIDGMTIHHQGAVTMAEHVLKETERPEIKQLAQNIIAAQNPEIEQMAAWRAQWYPGVPTTSGTGGHMGDMELSSDTLLPIDQRFITAMISHHEGAIAMATEAQSKAEHAEIKQLAANIIRAQEAEVQQLQAWQTAWFAK